MNLRPYNFIEIMLLLGFFLFLDIVSALTDIIMPSVISTAIQTFGVLTINLIAIFKNDKNSLKISKQMVKYLVQIIPFLPTLTLVFLFQLRQHNKAMKKQTNQ